MVFLKDSKPGIIQNLSALGIADLGTAVIGRVFWLVIPASINQIQTSKLLSKEKSRSVLISRLLGLSTMITLLVFLTPTMQEIGISIAFLASSIILCISLFIFNNIERG